MTVDQTTTDDTQQPAPAPVVKDATIPYRCTKSRRMALKIIAAQSNLSVQGLIDRALDAYCTELAAATEEQLKLDLS